MGVKTKEDCYISGILITSLTQRKTNIDDGYTCKYKRKYCKCDYLIISVIIVLFASVRKIPIKLLLQCPLTKT